MKTLHEIEELYQKAMNYDESNDDLIDEIAEIMLEQAREIDRLNDKIDSLKDRIYNMNERC